MAASSTKFIRLRLFFDYPPPAVAACRMCWLLVDLNVCRVVADLESIIREKFHFSRGSILSLFIEDCYLPHTESIYVVRDNDSVSVKVDCLSQVNGHSNAPDTANTNCRKRQRDSLDEGQKDEKVSVKQKVKKKKKSEDNSADATNTAKVTDKNEKSNKKKCTKNKKKTVQNVENPVSKTPDKPVAHKSTKKIPEKKKQKPPSSDSSSSSTEKDKAPQRKTPKVLSSTPAATKAPSNPKTIQKKLPPPVSSSSDTDSSTDEGDPTKVPSKPKPAAPSALTSKSPEVARTKTSTVLPSETPKEPQNQDGEEEEIQLVIRRPVQPNHGQWQSRGRGWGTGGPAERGRPQSGFVSEQKNTKEPSYETDTLSNKSVILQNGAATVTKDYSSMPLLAAPPQVGQKIAFKLLELTENYTPEVSEYKEGKILNFDPTTKQIELELLNTSKAPVEPGKFDLVYQNPDGSETVEYAVSRESWVTERWDSLLEPRLIL